jgi:hypothetical protein
MRRNIIYFSSSDIINLIRSRGSSMATNECKHLFGKPEGKKELGRHRHR